jgi:DMSO reductase family type II enzyme heme b subunit
MKVKSRSIQASELGQPDASVWQTVQAERIALMGIPIGLQPSAFIISNWTDKVVGKIAEVQVSALHNTEVIALRLEWADPNYDTDTDDNDHFPDGAAVLFPLKGDAPLVTMGSVDLPVNAWHWRADRKGEARNNVAAGLGSTRVTSGAQISTSARYHDGHWQLVFLRPLQVAGVDTTIQLTPGQAIKIAFAVWEGSNGERGGLKAFSQEWRELILE